MQPTAKRQSLYVLLVAMSVAGIAFSLASSSLYGVGVSSDSTAYISAARSLLAGHGLVCHDGALYTGWPPLFPLLLAGIGLAGVDPVVGVRFLNALAFGGTILASGICFARCLRSGALAVVATSSILLSYPLLDSSIQALTEPVFVLLIVLFVLAMSSFLKDGSVVSLGLASVTAGLCVLQRYTGVSLVAAGVMLIIVSHREASRRGRFRQVVVFLTVSCMPMTLWVVRNALVTHMLTGHERLHSIFSLRDNIVFAADTATKWFAPESIPLSVRLAIIAAVLLPATAALLSRARSHGGDDRGCCYAWPAGVVILVYVPLLVYTHQVGVLNEPLNDRYLLPLAVLVPWVLFAGLDVIRGWLQSRFRACAAVLVGLCLVWLAYPLGCFRDSVSTHRTYGAGGYSWSGCQTSAMTAWLHSHVLPGDVRSNAPDALYALTGRSAKVSPHRSWDIPAFQRTIASGAGEYLVWFGGRPEIYQYDLDELVELVSVEKVITFRDGGIYRLPATAPCVFPGTRIFSPCVVNGIWGRSLTCDQPGLRGEINSWILSPEGMMDSLWRIHMADGATLSLPVHGPYVRTGNAFESHCEGAATRPAGSEGPRYRLDVRGTVNGDTAAGAWRVEFTDPLWPEAIQGSWRVDLAGPAYRLYCRKRGKHRLTMDKAESLRLTNQLLDNWRSEGAMFYVYPAGRQPPDAQPVYGLRCDKPDLQLFTMVESERRALLDAPGGVWHDDGIAFYAFSTDSGSSGAQPVYRFWSGAMNDHLYTASEAERDWIIRDYSHVWTYEGIVWYAVAGRQD